MKNISLFVASLFLASCQSTPASSESETQIGVEISDAGDRISLNAGDLSTVAVWEEYVKAHNERDLEKIKALNSDTFKAYGPRGEFIDGSEAHGAFLSAWFKDNAPTWESNYFIANELTNEKGELSQWVTSGHDLTLTVEGKEVKVVQIHDALIKDGKVQMFYVYERVKQENE
ncbi:MAG: hypothetical protein ACPHSE_01885 [Flavobacteriaceae bacterium]